MRNSIKIKSAVGLIVFCGLAQALFAGGGWTYEKGKGYFKLGQSFLQSDQFFNPDGEIIDIRTTGYYATSFYGEYGLTDRLTAVAYVPFFTRNTLNRVRFRMSGREEPGDELNSVGDIDLSLKYGLVKSDKWVLAASVLFGLPVGETAGGETGILQSGDGEFNQMIRVDLSRPFASKAWFNVYAAFNNRTNDFSDEYRLGGEIGTRLGESFYVIGKIDLVQSLMNGTADPSMSGTLFSNNTEYLSPSLELAYELKSGFGLNASAAGAFYGRNILASPNYSVGVFYNL